MANDADQDRIAELLGLNENQQESFNPESPIEGMLAAAAPEIMLSSLSDEVTVVHRPWSPTGDETPRRTIELEETSRNPYTVPVAETAGGSIPAGFAQFRKFGPDEA